MNLGELWGHKDVLNDRTQDMRTETIGSGDGHDCQERDCRWGSGDRDGEDSSLLVVRMAGCSVLMDRYM